jgi:hypothetical protein
MRAFVAFFSTKHRHSAGRCVKANQASRREQVGRTSHIYDARQLILARHYGAVAQESANLGNQSPSQRKVRGPLLRFRREVKDTNGVSRVRSKESVTQIARQQNHEGNLDNGKYLVQTTATTNVPLHRYTGR